MDICLGVRYSC